MTPKEKAEELMQKAYDLDQHNKTAQSRCKQIALLCVEDRIKLIKELQVSDLMKYDLVEYEIMTQREIVK